ncbi:hypothetical protein PCYB_007140 [Plasmodium cynomolgi strain B]|uniref:CYIR protein n=1 Tax=Plasmodium cynomolgi (strain B) TaxID=1120755 RepID=K6V3L7_PLACD|nr:hypothetical protein PCYB_007140 [Plasmodium cynomolgi strain B]GAB69965.1 hypothetical protein PCYB_007140 [Plasmodium cynomolgi strain B]
MDKVGPETTTELFIKDYNLRKKELFNFYIEFNKSCNSDDDECKGINIPDSLNNNNLRNLYKKYIRNVKNIKNGNFSKFKNIDNEKNIEQLCIYLKYWIYDLISNHVTKDRDISTFFDACNSEINSLFSDKNFLVNSMK